MDVFEAIRTRRSIKSMTDAAPPRELIEQMLAAAIEAPNHFQTQPWRFFILAGKAREELGELTVEALRKRLGDDPKFEGYALAARTRVVKSPVIIAVATKQNEETRGTDHQVAIENLEATAAGVENMLLAANALGLAAHWRSGDAMFDPKVKAWLGLEPEDDIAAFVYVGYPDWDNEPPRTRSRDYAERTEWRGWE